MSIIKTAILSVSDKTGLVEFAQVLKSFGVKILSTGGTAKLLADNQIDVIEVSEHTGFPEMMDGRVKTLHPKIHGGILARRELTSHQEAMKSAEIEGIDLVVVNLYPFRETVANPNCSFEDAIENIDIGGPTMVRAAAKNYQHVAIITDPIDYQKVTQELQSTQGAIGKELRFDLAKKAFSHTAEYDAAISNYLTSLNQEGSRQAFPDVYTVQYKKAQSLRYGENPHQNAAFYVEAKPALGSLANFTQQQGKELSYNNIADSDAAWGCVKQFTAPACVIVKHANPCGVAVAENTLLAYQKAFKTDATSAFGGIIAFNRELDAVTAEAVTKQFLEVLIVPSLTAEAQAILATKQNVRVLTVPSLENSPMLDYKRVSGGLLIQSSDDHILTEKDCRIVTKKQPTSTQINDLFFAWNVAKFVKSNAIVFAGNGQLLGVGAGQMSRVDSTKIAQLKAEHAGLVLQGSVAASDAFFPFRDGVDVLAAAGASAIIQPGGSIRDEEVIAAANEHDIAMIFTGIRHFRH